MDGHFGHLGIGDGGLAVDGRRVFIKANLLKKSTPDEACVTHPRYVGALARALMSRGASVTVGDSPGGDFSASHLRRVYKGSGYEEVAAEFGFGLSYDTSVTTVGTGPTYKVTKAVLDSDLVVSAAKLKTHALMTYTGAVKNMFGAVPGLTKAQHHMKNRKAFASMLVDVCEAVRPHASFIDGIWGMEGNGPSGGTLRRMDVSVASLSPYAADAAAMALIGLGTGDVPYMAEAAARGLCPALGELEVMPEGFEAMVGAFGVRDYAMPETRMVSLRTVRGFLPERLRRLFGGGARTCPVVARDRCVGCGDCADICPASAVRVMGGAADIETRGCISCFCCHEVCPAKAIDIVPVGKLRKRAAKVGKDG